MIRRNGVLSGLIVLGSLGTAIAHAADTAYAANFLAGSREIVRFPVGATQMVTVIGPQTDIISGMDFDGAGITLRAINFSTQSLGTLSTESAIFTPTVALQAGCCTGGFTIDPVAGTIYVASGDHLIHTLDPATGTTIVVAPGAPTGAAISAIAMSCSGVLFSVGRQGDVSTLYRTDLNSAPVPIGVLSSATATSLDFDNRTGKLYGWFSASGAQDSTHGEVSIETAQVTGTSLLPGRFRMAIDNPCSVEQLLILRDGFEQ